MGESSVFDETELSGAFSIHFEAGKGDWTVFADYLYTEYSNDYAFIVSSLLQGSNVLNMHIAEFGGSYRAWHNARFELELLAGVRYLNVNNKFSFNNDVLPTIAANANIWDGFGGIRMTGHLTEIISARVRADVGGGDSDLVWNVIATVVWQFYKWASLYAGYRALDYQVSNDNIGLNLQGKGPVVGFGFHW